MNYSYIPNESFWRTNYLNKIDDFVNEFVEKIKDTSKYREYEISQEKYDEALLNYKKNHNAALYFFVCLGLFFSLILIIPFYWNLKKYKEMNQNKKELKHIIDVEDEQCIQVTNDLVKSIANDIYKCMLDVDTFFDFKPMGPITNELVAEIKKWSLFDLNIYDDKNPFVTQWYVLNKNKIVIAYSMQEEYWFDKTYTGSTTILVTRYVNGERVTESKIVTATYTHPAVEVNNFDYFFYGFMKSCENLEFKYIGKKIIKKQSKYPMENKEFDRTFDWEYNDNVQFRMIFTPHKQEMFMNEYYQNGKFLSNADKISKSLMFLHNEQPYSINSKELFEKDVIEKIELFIKNSDVDFNDFISNFRYLIKDIIYQKFLSLKHLITTPIIQSENHLDIINKVTTRNYCSYEPFYIVGDIFDKEIISRDTLCFNNLISNKIIKTLKKIKIHSCLMNGRSFDKISKTKYVYTYEATVPVDYYEYIPKNKQVHFYYCNLSSKDNLNIDNIIKEKFNKLEYIYKNDYLVIFSKENSKVVESIEQLINENFK